MGVFTNILSHCVKKTRAYRNLLEKNFEMTKKTTPQAFIGSIDFHVASFCNLNCYCCNNFAQFAPKKLPNFEQVKKDMTRLAEISNSLVKTLNFLGGEPLLNPRCIDFLSTARELFPNSQIKLWSNGILMSKQEESFFKQCAENKVEFQITRYPVKTDTDFIRAKCKEYGIICQIEFDEPKNQKTMFQLLLDEKGEQDPLKSFTRCWMANQCLHLQEGGRLFTCNPPASVHNFNAATGAKFEVQPGDYIDIYKAQSYTEILQFLAHPIPFCRFCRTDKWIDTKQWSASKKSLEEYIIPFEK